MVDRLDHIKKQQVFARLSIAKIHRMITIEDYFRLYSLLERIPWVDFKCLQQYEKPFYDVNGDTELLFATGALELETIDTKGGSNKYKLSRLGAALLRWGFGVNLELEHGKGTNVEIDTITAEDIEEITSEKIEEAKPKWENIGGDVLDAGTYPIAEEQAVRDIVRGK